MSRSVYHTVRCPASAVVLACLALPTLAVAQAGALDPTFGNYGVVTADLLGAANDYQYQPAARDPLTGRVVVAGGLTGVEGHSQWTLMAFTATGLRDAAFGANGVVRTDFQAFGADGDRPQAIAFDSSGASTPPRLLVAGTASFPDVVNSWPTDHLAVVAYMSDGSLDPAFGSAGKVLLGDIDSYQTVTMAVLADGRIVLGAMRQGEAIVCRLLHDGALDPGFGSAGTATLPGATVGVRVAAQPSGGIVVGRQDYTYSPVFTWNSTLTRLEANGQVDPGFGSNGVVDLAGESLGGLAARADGSLVLLVGTADTSTSRLRQLTATGASLGADTVLAADFWVASLDLGADGRIVLGGTRTSSYGVFTTASLTTNAQLDSTFDLDGYATLDLGGYQTNTQALALPGGAIAVVGLRYDPVTGQAATVCARQLADGGQDAAFAGGASFGAIPFMASTPDFGKDIAVHQADGKLVVLATRYGGEMAVLRYLPDGALDSSFGDGGVRLCSEPQIIGVSGTGLVLQSSGRIVVSGRRFTYLNVPPYVAYDLVLVGLDNTGALDATFGTGGIAVAPMSGVYLDNGCIAMQANDAILVGVTNYPTYSAGELTVLRFSANGVLDATFGTAGVAVAAVPDATVHALSAAVAADGRIAVAGHVETNYPDASTRIALAWFSSSGALLSGPTTPVPGFGSDVAVDASGRAVVVAQRFWGNYVYDGTDYVIVGASPWSQNQVGLVRVLANGALDPTFGNAGTAVVPVAGANDAFGATVAIQPDLRIVVAGSTTIETVGVWSNDVLVLRLLADGALDPTFGSGGVTRVDVGPIDWAQSVVLQGDGKLVVVGTAEARGTGYSTKDDVLVVRLLGTSNTNQLIVALAEQVRLLADQHLLNQGRARSLEAKLQAALNRFDHGQSAAAANQLTAFRNEVIAFRTADVLSIANATFLIAAADAILALLV